MTSLQPLISRRFAVVHRAVPIGWFLAIAALVLSPGRQALAAETGAQIYARLCASCHGDKGQGVSTEYAQPLAGDKPISELAALIDKTMPAGEPEQLDAAQSHVVAAYIYDAFYSPIAQARNQPARIELSRLTVRQYRNVLTDLVGSFRWNNTWPAERGLKGEYYDSRRPDKGKRQIERVDQAVKFDFGDGSPLKDKIKAEEFCVQWTGAIFAPETGDYEFVIRTENGAKLHVNTAWSNPVIDAGVRSGDDREFRGSIFLLGGRAYPLRLEYFKSKKSNEKTASIELLWKQPKHALEIIPARCLAPANFPEQYICTTPFPPDDRSMGYERGASISQAWDQATTAAALEFAEFTVRKLDEFSGSKPDDPKRREKVREFCVKLAERAFRRPLSDEQKSLYVDRQLAEVKDVDTAVTRIVLAVLKSPRFLFREAVGDARDPYNVASRLSFGLWDSLPDRQLLEAAARDQLKTREQVQKQAWRMVGDMRTQSKEREFLLQWLKVDQHTEVSKDPKQFPGFDEAMVSDLRTSLDMFLDDLVRGEKNDYRRLLNEDTVFLNGRLAKFYGAKLPESSDFQPVKFESEARAGIISHPYLLASLAYTGSSSPIHRGVFLSRSVLGRSLRPPPEAVAPLAPDLHASLTTRERVLLQTEAEACQSCHSMINALGFSLENFDAVGRFREVEKGKPVATDGTYITRSGETIKFRGAEELAKYLVSSDETHRAFVDQVFHYFVKQPIRAHGTDASERLTKSFQVGQFNIRNLLVDIATEAALPQAMTSNVASK
ncbi:MAG: DUF1592 domain-containing protein [Planctomycetes bacterium]|nr:DUF1592 domain-containing protein [Planctomycetota bacterium]